VLGPFEDADAMPALDVAPTLPEKKRLKARVQVQVHAFCSPLLLFQKLT
jgi:hypothetical protein